MKVAIYAHFNSFDRVIAETWHYLNELIRINFQVIFVSNSPICEMDIERLETICFKIILRENIGLDFGMWKSGLESSSFEQTSELLLTNSSIIGPLRPLSEVFEKATAWDCDFWGLTDNTEIAHHLQSYFVVFRKRVIDSIEFSEFWNSVLPYRSKQQIIMNYEVGLTVWLEERGFSWRSMFEQKKIYESQISNRTLGTKLIRKAFGKTDTMGNVTLLFPEILLKLGFPFIKTYFLNQGTSSIGREDARAMIEEYSKSRKPAEDIPVSS